MPKKHSCWWETLTITELAVCCRAISERTGGAKASACFHDAAGPPQPQTQLMKCYLDLES